MSTEIAPPLPPAVFRGPLKLSDVSGNTTQIKDDNTRRAYFNAV